MVRNLVVEKELKLKEGMKMMGLRNESFWLSWILTYLILFIILLILLIIIAKPVLFPYSDSGIIFVFFLSFCTSVMAAACLVTSFFRSDNVRCCVNHATVGQRQQAH